MKKILFAVLLMTLAATSSFAASAASSASDYTKTGLSVYGDKTTASATTAVIGRLSTGVHMAYVTSTAAYVLVTQHKSGVRKYGTAFDSTVINWMPALKDTNIALPDAPSVSAISGDGWTVM